MLKSAAEISQASFKAKEINYKNERKEREALRITAAAQSRSEQVHKVFEAAAQAAARAEKFFVVFPGHDIRLEDLNGQGFVAKRLMLRMEFEEYLIALCGTKIADLVRHCDLIVAHCPGLERLEGDALLHRNPLVSLLETLWRRQELEEPVNVELLFAYGRTLRDVNPVALEQMRKAMIGALEKFADLKRAESKYQSVRWENLTVQLGHTQATYVSWEASEDGGGIVDKFCAQKLKWLATRWSEIAELLSEWIDGESALGRSEFVSYVFFDGETWRLDSGCENDSPIDFCKPSLAIAELAALGYQVELLELSDAELKGVVALSSAEQRVRRSEAGAYRMGIRWP